MVARDDWHIEALQCFAQIVKSCAEEEVVGLYANDTLQNICALGLSAELGVVLTDITTTLPYTLKRVQKHLLHQISRTLDRRTDQTDRRRHATGYETEPSDTEDKLVCVCGGVLAFQGAAREAAVTCAQRLVGRAGATGQLLNSRQRWAHGLRLLGSGLPPPPLP